MLGRSDNRLMDVGQAQGKLRRKEVLEVCEVLPWLLFFSPFFFCSVGKSFQMRKKKPAAIQKHVAVSLWKRGTADCYKSV